MKYEPPDRLQASVVTVGNAERMAKQIFAHDPDWCVPAAVAALYDLRPGLGTPDRRWLDVHLRHWHRNEWYFAGLCKLLKAFSVGTDK